MKKFGFTLAEVLVTLGVIGVISALTIPTLMTNYSETHIGPKLAKAVASFEQANKNILDEHGVDALTETGIFDNISAEQIFTKYYDELSKHLRVSNVENYTLISKDGVSYFIYINQLKFENPSDPAYKQMIGSLGIFTDNDRNNIVDGTYAQGSNFFGFTLWNDGSLRPIGGVNWNGKADSAYGGSEHWKTKCPIGGLIDSNEKGSYCTGHIFENDLKILYKYKKFSTSD